VEAGARVDDVAAYRTVASGDADLVRVRTLLEGGGIDCAVFTSSSAVRNFAALFDVAELLPLLDGVKVACIGEVTSATAREFGVKVDVQPTEPNFSALGAAIARYFSEIDQQVR
jgi:uroporphyrinogen III methyltransferase/synthase